MAVHAICLAKMFHDLAATSAIVIVSLTESVLVAPNSAYTEERNIK